MTSTTKDLILTNPEKYLPKNSNINKLEEEKQFSWYYVHFLINTDISKIGQYINIEGKDKIIKNTYILFLSNKQLQQISNISLVKRIEPEEKFYEVGSSIESTSYFMVITLPSYKLQSKEDTYIVQKQYTVDSYIVQVIKTSINSEQSQKEKTIKILSNIPEVKSITPFTKPILHNAISAGYAQRNSDDYKQLPGRGYYYLDRYLNNNGLNGEGEIITILDTIIDFTHSMFRDDNVSVELNQYLPNHRKFVYYGYDYPDTFIDDMFDDEHGTHTAATAAGKSICSIDNENISYFNGIAPEAKLLYGGYYTDVSAMALQSLMRTYHSNISTNSWGSRGYHLNYNFQYSRIAESNPQIIFIFSAGNLHIELGNFSVADPSGSKDILSVGAIDSFYENQSYSFIRKDNKQSVFIAHRIANTVYPYISGTIGTEAGKSKFLAIETTKGNQCKLVNNSQFVLYYGEDQDWIHNCNYVPKNQVYWTENKTAVTDLLDTEIELATLPIFSMQKNHHINRAAFSSTGPGYHGILKPDLVAPGSQIISARSQAHSTTPHGCLEDFFNDFKTMDGTSMATPNVAGAAALIRQYFRSGKWIDKVIINGATTRAILINSCRHPRGSKIPDIIFGHGVVDLSTVIPINDDFGVQITHQETEGDKKNSVKEKGHVISYLSINKTKLVKKLQITLSYLDSILSSDSLIPLAHDLDLVVISPSKKVYLGDHLNNNDTQHASTNEKVIINDDEIEDGQYTIHVFAGSFADGVPWRDPIEQDFSVVASGPIDNGYLEFEESKECLCDKCDPDHPNICLCDVDKNIGPLCQVKIDTCNENKGVFLVEPLQIRRIKFIADGNITYITSKSTKPGRDATVWVSNHCHLSLGEYEINGQTTNETTEKEININFETNEICVAIFNNNDVDASYSIEIHSKNNDGPDSSDFTIDNTMSEEMSETSEIVHTESMSEIINPTETSDIVNTESMSEIINPTETSEIVHTESMSEIINQTETSDIVHSTEASEIINPTETSKIVHTTEASEIIHTDPFSYTDNNDSDTDNNSKNKKKTIIIGIVVAMIIVIVLAMIITVIYFIKSGKCTRNKFDTSTSIFYETLLDKEKI